MISLPPSFRCCSLPAKGHGGFALIIALVCMGFMLLLLLSLSLLSSTELTVGKQQETLARARANALLGLNVAIGELQRTLGADQRISAPAAIRSTATEGRGHWTGAWKSNPNGGQATDFLGWLISLPQGTTNALVAADATGVSWETLPDGSQRPQGEDWVAMVSEQTVDPTQTPAGVSPLVMAGAVKIDDDGRYAWWIGDEGIKARVSLPPRVTDPGLDADAPANLMRNLLSPSHYGVHKVGQTGTVKGPLTSIDPASPDLVRMLNLNQLSLLPSVTDANVRRSHFHDLSLNSSGLLTDSRNGGLRLDLTHLLEHDTAFTRQFGGQWDRSYMFTPPGAGINFQYGAPNWGILRSFYKLPESIDDNSNSLMPFLSVSNSAGNNGGNVGTTGSPYQASGDVYQINSPVHPLLSWYQLTFWLEYIADKQDDDSVIWRPRLHLRPLVAIYNPYDIHLKGHDYPIYIVFSPMLKIQVEGKDPVFMRLSELTPSNRLRMTIPANLSNLRPGETRLYGLDDLYRLSDATGVSKLIDDDNANASYYVDLSKLYDTSSTDHDPAGTQSAQAEGPTAAEHRYNPVSRPDGSKNWGLTVTERQRLEYVRPSTAPSTDPYPFVTFSVSFNPGNNADDSKDQGGQVNFRFGTQTHEIATMMNTHYRLDKADLRPEDASVGAAIDAIGANRNQFWIGMGMRTLDSSQAYLRQFIDANPRFLISSMRQEGFENVGDHAIISGWTGASKSSSGDGSGWLEEWTGPDAISQSVLNGRFVGNFGRSRNTSGSDSVILYHVPRESPRSLGLFQHAALGRFSRHQGYIVGNSYAPPRIPTNATKAEPMRAGYDSGRVHNAYDWAYAVNLELWDKYFLSAIPQDLDDTMLAAYLSGSRTLPNPRLRLTTADGNAPTVARLTAAAEADTATNVAAHLLLEGAFNVNSVSVEAWKALLASSAGLDIPVYDPANGNYATSNTEDGAVFYRTPFNFQSGEATSGNSSRFWGSYRHLSDTELTTLATQIVAEIKARGPFGSLADFINRRPGSSTADHRKRGALQAALDTAVNKNLSAQAGSASNALEIPDYNTGYTSGEDRKGTAAPGWLLQGDLLQAIGPLLAVRSDTFIIRAYGEATDAQGNTSSRIWCEAIVQRVAEKVDTTEAIADAGPIDGYGRRFVVTSFRWLDAP